MLRIYSNKGACKDKFFLKVTGKRADGYHTIASLMQKVTLYDHLELRLVDSSGIILHCPDNVLPADDTNLAYRAAQIFLQSAQARLSTFVCGVDITLVKKIPIAAGLGGGAVMPLLSFWGLIRFLRIYSPNGNLQAWGCN